MVDDLPEGQMLFTLQEVSRYLKISISSLHRWRRGGRLDARKVGKQWRIRRDELSRLAGSRLVSLEETRLIMPDEVHGVRRPWSNLLESADMVEFVELRVVKMALDAQDTTAMSPLIEGLTTRELQEYRAALEKVIGLADAVLGTRGNVT